MRPMIEPDTVTIVEDVLAELFGSDSYAEVTGEHGIRGTYRDLAVKLDGRLELVIEVKAIGLDLKDPHVEQAADFAADHGVEWAVSTNGARWRIFRVTFAKPIDQEFVLEFDLTEFSARSGQHVEWLYLLSREAIVRAAMHDSRLQRQATSRFVLGAVVLSDTVVDIIRRALRRMAPDVRIDADEIRAALENDVLEREVVAGDQADSARRKVQRAATKALRVRAARADDAGPGETTRPEPIAAPGESAAECHVPDSTRHGTLEPCPRT
jgi:hypothetical protein